jgi:hypothetical protein
VLGEIVNGVAPARRQHGLKTPGGCEPYNVYLCRTGTCFEQFHNNNNTKQLAGADISIILGRQAFLTLVGTGTACAWDNSEESMKTATEYLRL